MAVGSVSHGASGPIADWTATLDHRNNLCKQLGSVYISVNTAGNQTGTGDFDYGDCEGLNQDGFGEFY